jgi:hypothetical protein
MDAMNMESSMADATDTMTYTGDLPWYLRTLPGRTGDFMGHFIPGLCYSVLGSGLLLLALYRSRQLGPHSSFADAHIPENDPWFLQWFGLANIAGPVVGTIYEILDSDPGFDPVAFTHSSLYLGYFIMGICALYESKGRLPLDTHRAALVLACVVQALLWQAHGSMKKLPADGALHILLGYLNWATAAVIAYSMRYPDSVIAYLAGWAGLLVQGLWIILSGLYECCIDLSMHMVSACLAMLCLLVFLIIVVVTVHFGPSLPDQDIAKYRGKYTVLGGKGSQSDSLTLEDEELEESNQVESGKLIGKVEL